MVRSLTFLTVPLFKHVNNNHKAIIDVQADELGDISTNLTKYFNDLSNMIDASDFDKLDDAIVEQNLLFKLLEKYRKNQVKRIKQQEVGTRNSMLYLNILSELRNILLYSINVVKAQRDFVKYSGNQE